MNLKEYPINGKTYDVSKVSELLLLGDNENAKFSLSLLTNLSDEECDFVLESIAELSKTEIESFKHYPIGGKFYNVESVMEVLLQGDVLNAYKMLQEFGIDSESCKAVVRKLNDNIEAYRNTKAFDDADFERQIKLEREVDKKNWYAPSKCPNCGAIVEWQPVGKTKGGFSGGKAVAGAVFLGPLGLAAGALGTKQIVYQCSKCGTTKEYSKGSRTIAGWKDKLNDYL